jgi:hypothetical protein
MSTETCPFCGFVRQPRSSSARRDGFFVPAGPQTRAPDTTLDRVMIWVVGALLVALIAAAVVIQARPRADRWAKFDGGSRPGERRESAPCGSPQQDSRSPLAVGADRL